ncbi:MAG TPA: membrane protein insertase YidC, partial [Phycisphaerae bacterium]|nr:membrane protein insertase YidC [Phycisphaerae bacterium]
MEKRVLLAVFLSFLVLFVYQSVFAPPPRPPQNVTPAATPATPATASRPATAPVASAPAATEQPPAQAEANAPETLTADAQRRDIVVETARVRAVFSNRGAELRSWRLKDYLDQNGEPLDLVPTDMPPDLGHPFDLLFDDPALTRRLSEALFEPSVTGLNLEAGRPGTLVFEYRDAAGLHARKTFAFDPGTSPFLVSFSAEVVNGGETL